MQKIKPIILACSFLMMMACSDNGSSGPGVEDVAGKWQGKLAQDFQGLQINVAMDMDLQLDQKLSTQANATIGGEGMDLKFPLMEMSGTWDIESDSLVRQAELCKGPPEEFLQIINSVMEGDVLALLVLASMELVEVECGTIPLLTGGMVKPSDKNDFRLAQDSLYVYEGEGNERDSTVFLKSRE